MASSFQKTLITAVVTNCLYSPGSWFLIQLANCWLELTFPFWLWISLTSQPLLVIAFCAAAATIEAPVVLKKVQCLSCQLLLDYYVFLNQYLLKSVYSNLFLLLKCTSWHFYLKFHLQCLSKTNSEEIKEKKKFVKPKCSKF